ncbi:MAG: GNAT family N-acetyltransferase [Chloroflexi bacterium]|nr:GNAT family N-acetyltransferase [Chloroflexota bacterium]
MMPPVLHGQSVTLRPVESADLEPLRRWYNAPETFRYMGRDEPLTAKAQAEWHTRTRDDQSVLSWAVTRSVDGTLIGSITLRNLDDPARRGELGVLLGIPGSGFGSDAVRTVLAHAFGGLDLQCVSLEVRGDNRRAITAYMRAGFRPEGVLRRRLFKAGELHDLYAMSILPEEFEAGIQEF